MNRPYTDEQWCVMVDKEISSPVPLHEADLMNYDWLYYRPWGVMYVSPGMHTVARATLLAFRHGFLSYLDLLYSRGKVARHGLDELAEEFLMEVPGTAFLSSVSDSVLAGKRENLDSRERQAFRKFEIRYIEDRD